MRLWSCGYDLNEVCMLTEECNVQKVLSTANELNLKYNN